MVIEAGRGPGGRASTRLRRDQPCWRLDHGAPVLHLLHDCEPPLADLLSRLKAMGALVPDQRQRVCVGLRGLETEPDDDVAAFAADGSRWRGAPSMSAVAGALLDLAGEGVERRFGVRIQRLERAVDGWRLRDQNGQVVVSAPVLVLSGSLLAHPRSLAMLGLTKRPLRDAVPVGFDPSLDQALERIGLLEMAPRWNRMLDLPSVEGSAHWPHLIELTPAAAQQWQVERLVLQPQEDGRTALVVHGLHERAVVPEALVAAWPSLARALASATDLGLMRWGAARPLNHPLPAAMQWCSGTAVGFCGDWIEGPGFASAHGALRSAVDLAMQLLKDDSHGLTGASA